MSNPNQPVINLLLSALGQLGWTPPQVNQPPATTPAPPVVDERPEVGGQQPTLAWGAKVSETFRDRVWWIADELTRRQGSLFDANWLMACMAFETGERFTAGVKNPKSSATGLIQFMRTTAIDLGTTVEKLAKMTAEDQLNYVFKYFDKMIKAKGPIRSIDDCYMAILWPAGIGKPMEYKLWVKGSSTFTVNAGLDTNKDSVITKAEAAAKVMEKLVKGLQPQLAA